MTHSFLRLFLISCLAGGLSLAQDHQVMISSTFYTVPTDAVTPAHTASQDALIAFLAEPPEGSSVIASPNVLSLSGMNSQIEIVREIIYPTEYDRGEDGAPIPTAFETREVGLVLNATATVSAGDRPSILLATVIEMTDLVGWLDMRNPAVLVPAFSKPAPAAADAGLRMLQPVFSSYEFNSALSLKDGGHVVFAGGKKDGSDLQYFVSLQTELMKVEVPPAVAATEKKLRELILPQLVFKDAQVADVISFLSAAKGAPNLVLKGTVNSTISLDLRNVSMRDALEFICDISNLDLIVGEKAVTLRPKPVGVPAGGDDPFGDPFGGPGGGADPFGGEADPFGGSAP